MLLKDFFKTLAERAGVAVTEAKFKEAFDAMPELDIDDDMVAKPITGNLITESEAESRPKIKGKFTAEALNGIDALVDPILGDIFDATELESFKTENKGTTKKIAKLAAKAKELKASNKPSDQAELHATITKLNEQVAQVKADSETAVNTLKTEHETALNNVKSDYDQKLYYNGLASKVIGRSDVVDYAKAKDGKRFIDDFKDTLETLGGVLDIKTGKVMTKADPLLPLYVDNKPATAESLTDKTLTDNQYIKKSDGPPPAEKVQVPGGGGGGPEAQQTEAQKRNAARLNQE